MCDEEDILGPAELHWLLSSEPPHHNSSSLHGVYGHLSIPLVLFTTLLTALRLSID